MHTFRRTIAYALLSLVGVAAFGLVVAGLDRVDLAVGAARYMMERLSLPLALAIFAAVGGACITLAFGAARALELPLSECASQLGRNIATGLVNARTHTVPMVALIIGGGALVFLAVSGAVALSL